MKSEEKNIKEVPSDAGCLILHVDMDAFYASVSLLDHPHLADKPVIVGGGWRSVVLSATYPARAAGVRSGIPVAQAKRLCPQASIIPPDYEQYSRVSETVMAVFREVTDHVEPVSMEEAFLDVRAARRRWGSPTRIGQWIRDTIADELNLPCSVGGAGTKVVAKMASRAAKPDGILMVPPTEVVSFLHPLPVKSLWGVGPATESELHRLGLHTVADIAHLPHSTLARAMGNGAADYLKSLAWGADHDAVKPVKSERSTGASQTFDYDIDDPELCRRQLLHLSERTAGRMRRSNMLGRTVVLTVRFADFTTITRSRTLATPTNSTREVHAAAQAALAALGLQRARVRLLGVRVEGLSAGSETLVQHRLDEPKHGWADAERAMDRAASRFGEGAVRPASLVGPDALPGRHPAAL